MRKYIVTNASRHDSNALTLSSGASWNATYLTYPDETFYGNRRQHGRSRGDVRVATAPFVAFRHMKQFNQSFKWMLYGVSAL